MKKKQIYEDGSSKLEIEFDGEYFQITQTIFGVEASTISVTLDEIEQLFKSAKGIK